MYDSLTITNKNKNEPINNETRQTNNEHEPVIQLIDCPVNEYTILYSIFKTGKYLCVDIPIITSADVLDFNDSPVNLCLSDSFSDNSADNDNNNSADNDNNNSADNDNNNSADNTTKFSIFQSTYRSASYAYINNSRNDSTKTEELFKHPAKKYKKKRILMSVRNRVWTETFGDTSDGNCVICGTIIHKDSFECGHIIAESKGGTTTINNLKAICSTCNKSIGARNMDEFMKSYKMEYKIPVKK
jgi:ribosomal protein S27E